MRRIAWAVLALGTVVEPAVAGRRADHPDVRELQAGLKKADVESRRKTAETICELCKDGDGDFAGEVPALIEALKDKDAIVRGEIAESLGFIGPDEGRAPRDPRAAERPDPRGPGEGAFAVGGFGEDAKATVPDLIPLLKDKDERCGRRPRPGWARSARPRRRPCRDWCRCSRTRIRKCG